MSGEKSLAERRKEKISSGHVDIFRDSEVYGLLFSDSPQGKENRRLTDNWARALVSQATLDLDFEARRKEAADSSRAMTEGFLYFMAMGMIASGEYDREGVERYVAFQMLYANSELQNILEYASKKGEYCIQEGDAE